MGGFTQEPKPVDDPFQTPAPQKKAAPPPQPAPEKKIDPMAVPGGADTEYAKPFVDGEEPYESIEAQKKDSKTGVNVADRAVTHERTNETTIEQNGVTQTTGTGTKVQVGQTTKIARSTKAATGENEHEREDELAAGYKDGKAQVELATSSSVRDAKTGSQDRTAIGLNGSELELKRGHTDTQYSKDDLGGEKAASQSHDFGVGLGPNGGSASYAATNHKADGSSNTTAANAGVDDGMAHAGVAMTHTGADGKSVGVSVSVHGGTKVEASPAVAAGDHFVVSYRKTEEKGSDAGGTAHGVGVGGGATEGRYTNGTRSFKTKEEADEFQAHAAEKLEGGDVDPRTAAGALTIPIGEVRGAGHETGEHGSASVGVEGASVGGTASKTEGANLSVKRTGEKTVEMTFTWYKSKSLGGNTGGFGVSEGYTSTDDEATWTTIRYDLSNEDEARSYEFSQRNGAWMGGGQIVARGTHKGNNKDDATSIAGLGEGHHTDHTWEDHTQNATGTHDAYSGEGGDSNHHSNVVMKFLDGGDTDDSGKITGRKENGKVQNYQLTATTSADKDGGWNMGHLEAMTGMNDQHQEHGGKASGKWSLTAELPKAEVDKFCETIAGGADFDYGPKHALQEALRAAKTPDDKMRAVAAFVGADAAEAFKEMGGHEVPWDVQLEGDANFPGEKGRLELEHKIAVYQAGLASKTNVAGGLVGGIATEVANLEARRAAVADEKQYTDLPNPMRAAELQKIDRLIEQMEALHHTALVQASKVDPAVAVDAKKDAHGGKAAEHVSPDQAQLAKLRGEIGQADGHIAALTKSIGVAQECRYSVQVDSRTFGGDNESYHDYTSKDRIYGNDAKALVAAKQALDGFIDEKRAELVKSLEDPKEAAEVGEKLLALVRAQEKMMEEADREAQADLNLVVSHTQ